MSSSSSRRVLVTGASGTTGRLLIDRLADVPVTAAVRRPDALPSADDHDLRPVAFDWLDAATWEDALADVDAAYLVPPPLADPEPLMRRFVEHAVQRGVRRMVLHRAHSIEAAPTSPGLLQTELADLAPEWAVLRPSWFMQNLLGDHPQARSLRELGSLRTATGPARVPFVDADDIAAVARVALLDPPLQRDVVVTGPQSLTYDEVAAAITEVTGRSVHHEHLTEDEALDVFSDYPADVARLLVDLDLGLAAGRWNETTDEVERLTGRPPRDLRSFLQAHAGDLKPCQPSSGETTAAGR